MLTCLCCSCWPTHPPTHCTPPPLSLVDTGIKEGSAPAKLGVRGRCEGHWRALADTLAHHPGRLGEAFLKLSPGGAPLQVGSCVVC